MQGQFRDNTGSVGQQDCAQGALVSRTIFPNPEAPGRVLVLWAVGGRHPSASCVWACVRGRELLAGLREGPVPRGASGPWRARTEGRRLGSRCMVSPMEAITLAMRRKRRDRCCAAAGHDLTWLLSSITPP